MGNQQNCKKYLTVHLDKKRNWSWKETHPPRVLVRIVIEDGSENHELGASSFEKSYLVSLAHCGEGSDFFGHPYDSFDGQIRQVNDRNQIVRVAGIPFDLNRFYQSPEKGIGLSNLAFSTAFFEAQWSRTDEKWSNVKGWLLKMKLSKIPNKIIQNSALRNLLKIKTDRYLEATNNSSNFAFSRSFKGLKTWGNILEVSVEGVSTSSTLISGKSAKSNVLNSALMAMATISSRLSKLQSLSWKAWLNEGCWLEEVGPEVPWL